MSDEIFELLWLRTLDSTIGVGRSVGEVDDSVGVEKSRGVKVRLGVEVCAGVEEDKGVEEHGGVE